MVFECGDGRCCVGRWLGVFRGGVNYSRVLLMMREWNVAGRYCTGCGWWCAMSWIFWGVIMGFAHPQRNSLQIQSDYGKKNTISCCLGLCIFNAALSVLIPINSQLLL